MRLKLCVCLAVLGVAFSATQALAAPVFDPFLLVDVDGGAGPTQAGWTPWSIAQGGLTPWALNGGVAGINLAVGPVAINMKGIAPNSIRDTRNRGDHVGPLEDMYQDFAFASRGVDGFGRHYIRLAISGLDPDTIYEFTHFNREPSNSFVNDGPDPNVTNTCTNCSSWMAWSDRDRLGGLDGPDAWMDANVGVGALYQPTFTADPNNPTNGVYKNPIPTATRSRVSGPNQVDPYDPYSGSFFTRSDAAGTIYVYGWADPQGYSASQTASLVSGFTLAETPEPGSIVLALVGIAGMAGIRRRG